MPPPVGEICSHTLWATPKPINDLDRKLIMNNGTTLSVDYATKDLLPVCYEMLQEAAKRGDNVGTDEFGSFEEVNESYFYLSETFQVLDSGTNQTKAFLLISPCIYARGYYTCIASVRVIRSPDIDDVTWARLVKLATQLVEVIDVGYTQCVIDVALCHSQLIRLLRDEAGFHVTAFLPHCVNISGVGLYWNAILARHLDIPDKPMFSMTEIRIGVDNYFPEEETEKAYQAAELSRLDFLPQRYVFRCGIRAVIRNMRKEEDVILYEMMKEAMELGEGYAINEHPTLASFRGELILTGTCCVFEEEGSGKIIGFSVTRKSWYTRSQTARICESDIIISKQFRGRGVGKEMTHLELGIAKDIGFQFEINDTTMENDRMIRIYRTIPGSFILGSLQKAAYSEGTGWIDVLLAIFEIRVSLKQLLKENSMRVEITTSKI